MLSSRGRQVKITNYFFGSKDSGSESDESHRPKKKEIKTRVGESHKIVERKEKVKRTKQKKGKSDDDSFSNGDMIESTGDSDCDLSFDDMNEDELKPKKKVVNSKNKKQLSKSKNTSKDENSSGKVKIKMSDAFQPMNTPIFPRLSLSQISEDKSFLDPCGMEATDDIIDRLVGNQLDKVGSLLHRAISNTKENLNFNPFPLKLGTACSGTDAPALALTLIQEQMKLRGYDFDFDHVFSCENEPFKQAYLARNFSSILYPDITKLPMSDEPRDVFGQPKRIPPFNMFVAGTSCKNFSMLRSRYRIDIEDKGCSGETFLAATEILFKEQPHFAIFENVIGAPWGKMQEYITGRVKLSECDNKKAVKVDTKDKKKDLIFCLDKDKNIIVDQVPSVYGVRCQCEVEGFLTESEPHDVKPIIWPHTALKKNGTCTLTELMIKNKICKKTDTLVFRTPCTYCTHTVKVDTKNYGLPQTRMRTYMFVWKPVDDNINDDLGKYWETIVKFMESPVRHSLESFILEVDHDIIRVFREALSGPAGRQTKRGLFMEPDFWTSANANLRHNKIAREKLGFDDMTRTLTKWDAFGAKQIPPHYWLEYANMLSQREIDLLEILHASSIRDAESHDSNFSSFFWNVSQNASKEKHRSACPGIAGCITPGGEFFLPHVGRPLLGCEKLLLQGIPYFRLALGNETEVQIGDLAGNAMSLTVVCATMLGAIMAQQLRKETMESKHKDMNKILKSSGIDTSQNKQMVQNMLRFGNAFTFEKSSHVEKLLKDLASLAPEAINSSIWCTCETSGRNSLSEKFLQCKVCRVTCCRDCVGTTAGYQLDSHDTFEVTLSPNERNSGSFQNKLRNLAPPTLLFGKNGIDNICKVEKDMYRVKGLERFAFNLHRIKRDRKKWLIIYYARENNGIGEAIAEFRIIVGEFKTQSLIHHGSDSDIQTGVRGELKCFRPAKTPPLVYGMIEPCATVTVLSNESMGKCEWFLKTLSSIGAFSVVGSGETESIRKESGITEIAQQNLLSNSKAKHNKKVFDAAYARGEVRRWRYAKNWMIWPKSITIDSDTSYSSIVDIRGTYERAECRQTVNQSALWIKAAEKNVPTLYLLMKPEVSRTGPDKAVISSSLSHHDSSSIVAIFPINWEPNDSLNENLKTVKNIKLQKWQPFIMECKVPVSSITVTATETISDTLLRVQGLKDDHFSMFSQCFDPDSMACLNDTGRVKLNVTRGQKAQQTVRVLNALCVAPILKFAAQNGLPYDMGPDGKWIDITTSKQSVPFGCCKTVIPPRPKELWHFNNERKVWERQSEAGASRKYYLALQNAPQAFEIWLDRAQKQISIVVNPEAICHHSAAPLIERRCAGIENEIQVQYRLVDTLQQSDPILHPFKVNNCDEQTPTFVPLKKPFTLYERQQKAVTKMIAIENQQTAFEEIEMSEQELPGSTGWSLIAKASRTRKICGGVIADCIGAGKTVVSIAIILKGLEASRASRRQPRKSSASLVVVPPGLIDQWKSELNKFTSSMKVLCIYDFSSIRKYTVKEIIEADVVIAPIDILESKDYLQNVIKKATKMKKDIDGCPKLPAYTGQLEKLGADGVWIPASSADPYGGANNSNNQKRRNESAYYTFIYLDCIQKLREMNFSSSDRGVPLEYFEWERVIVDEIHESLCTTKDEMKSAKEASASSDDSGFFQERNRRAGRELLGITERNVTRRPLVFRKGIFGLTGTPLLDSSSRVIELANLMGNTYVIGLSSHWRKLERESSRDIFLHNYLEPKQSREIRKNIYAKCQAYLKVAALRNKSGDEMKGIELITHVKKIIMTEAEKVLYMKSQSGIEQSKRSFAIKPEDFDPSAGHDVSKFLRQNAKFESRGRALVEICKKILSEKGQDKTKIIVFTDGRIGGGEAARDFLREEKSLGCTKLDQYDTVETKNKKIAWYQNGDATKEDKLRPRTLVLHFEHAAGLNLQTECNHLILFTPLYTNDPVADASTELQAIGRVFRPGQTKPKVNVYRIEIQGPEGEDCLDGQLIRRNTDEDTIAMAINSND